MFGRQKGASPQDVSALDAGLTHFVSVLASGGLDSCDVVITGEGSIDEQTLAGKLPAAVARRSGIRPIIAVAGRSLLPRQRWSEMSPGLVEGSGAIGGTLA